MATIKNVAIAGASGSLGSVLFKKLVEAGNFNVRVLRRQGSKSTFPPGTDVVDVDFSSVDSLSQALAGQDAVICATGDAAAETQQLLIDAAVAAGVKRFLPSEFGSNLDNPTTRALPVYVPKVKVQDYLIAKASASSLTYTLVYNNAFLDWGIKRGFLINLSSPRPVFADDGENLFSTATLDSVGTAVVGVLNHPEATKNRAVYIHDAVVSQNKLLQLARKALPDKSWDPQYVKITDMVDKANERLSKGLLGMETFAPYLIKAVADPECGGKFDKTDNELLGIKGITDAEIIELFK